MKLGRYRCIEVTRRAGAKGAILVVVTLAPDGKVEGDTSNVVATFVVPGAPVAGVAGVPATISEVPEVGRTYAVTLAVEP